MLPKAGRSVRKFVLSEPLTGGQVAVFGRSLGLSREPIGTGRTAVAECGVSS